MPPTKRRHRLCEVNAAQRQLELAQREHTAAKLRLVHTEQKLHTAQHQLADACTACFKSNWRDIPSELLQCILSTYLDPRDIQACCCVCLAWRDASSDECFWKDQCEITWARPNPRHSVSWMLQFVHRKSFEQLDAFPGCMRELSRPATPARVGANFSDGSLSKIFSSVWVDNNVLLAGMKDNRIIRWKFDPTTWYCQERKVVTLPDAGRVTISNHSSGQHSIALNQRFGGNKIACGGSNPSNVLILDSAAMTPLRQLSGHTDKIFSCCWVDRSTLISCSKDTTVRLWSTDTDHGRQMRSQKAGQVLRPTLTRQDHSHPVRDMTFNAHTKQLASIDTQGTVKFWDSSALQVVSSIQVDSASLCCIECDEMSSDLLVLGGSCSISFIDPRCASLTAVISTGACGGLCSLSFRGHIVTAGSGNGHLYFYDVRRDFGSIKTSLRDTKKVETRLFPSPTNSNPVYYDYVEGHWHKPAVFSHAYNPSGSMLFTGGGGFEKASYSSYATLWDTSLGLQVQAARDAEAARQTRAPELARAGGR